MKRKKEEEEKENDELGLFSSVDTLKHDEKKFTKIPKRPSDKMRYLTSVLNHLHGTKSDFEYISSVHSSKGHFKDFVEKKLSDRAHRLRTLGRNIPAPFNPAPIPPVVVPAASITEEESPKHEFLIMVAGKLGTTVDRIIDGPAHETFLQSRESMNDIRIKEFSTIIDQIKKIKEDIYQTNKKIKELERKEMAEIQQEVTEYQNKDSAFTKSIESETINLYKILFFLNLMKDRIPMFQQSIDRYKLATEFMKK